MKVKDVMTSDVKGVEIPGNREEALELLKELKVSALPAIKQGTNKLIGIIRLRDFFENPDESQLGMLVNRDIITITPDAPVEEAAKKMLENNVRRLPVIEDEKLSGIITVRDIVYRVIAEREIEAPALGYMQKSITLIWEDTPLKVAVEILGAAKARALPVIDSDGKLVGIIGDADIINVSEVETEEIKEQMGGRSESDSWTWDSEDRIYITKRSLKPSDKLVKDVMTKDVVTITKRTDATKCAKLLKEHQIEQVPVTSGRKLLGIVRDDDLLKVLSE
ncbi:hypothetical protein AKJ35_01245 [candidate division MSBL1 archaeon SCGC-AAA833F18]|uniref:CBS domain-containing protein n=2 Tax=candidate division MSBL1 TaxID=215777 RepID=A0A133VRZ6_9EURY|nr:hypothetical protein AKJ44_01970 [candidate division MSBL1 archaeon SCGC-AAA261F17]KXB09197.1 hypothetical protein AKJ35_01245 [candidate division MSBL1 archaeon SCGC-AAA833F18]